MNRICLIVLGLATVLAIDQGALAAPSVEFADVPWGAPPATVRQIIGKRPGTSFVAETPDRLTFTGGTFAGENAADWRFDFAAGRFRTATVTLTPKFGKDAQGFLNDQIEKRILKMLEEKYGKARRIEGQDHREYNWTFPEALHPGESKTIRLFHGWAPARRIEVTYSHVFSTPVVPKPKQDL